LTIIVRPQKHVDVARSDDDLAVAIQRNSSNIGDVQSLLVLPTEEWRRDNVVTGDDGRLGGLGVCTSSGEMKMLITLFTKLKAYFKYKRLTDYLLYTLDSI